MFEFHGWINIWAGDPDETAQADVEAAVVAVRARAREAEAAVGCWFEVRVTSNGQIVLVAHGLRNHPQDEPLAVFRWVAERYSMSYGLLYVHNDQDEPRHNEFVVYRLAQGAIAEFPDSLLSPFVPTADDGLDPEPRRARTAGN